MTDPRPRARPATSARGSCPHLLEHGHEVRGRVVVARPIPSRFGWDHAGRARSAATSPTPAAGRGRRSRTSTRVGLPRPLARPHRLHRPRPARRGDRGGRRRRQRRTTPRLPLRAGAATCPRPSSRRHIASRLEVERILPRRRSTARSRCGRASCSAPGRRRSRSSGRSRRCSSCSRCRRGCSSSVQPVAVSDVLARDHRRRSGTTAPTRRGRRRRPRRHRLPRPDARLRRRGAGLTRRRGCRRLVAPTALVGLGDRPWSPPRRSTRVTSLIESLRHDMVCRPGPHVGARATAVRSLGLEEARRSGRLDADVRRPRGARCPRDPAWARPLPLLTSYRSAATRKAAARLALPPRSATFRRLGRRDGRPERRRGRGLDPGSRPRRPHEIGRLVAEWGDRAASPPVDSGRAPADEQARRAATAV